MRKRVLLISLPTLMVALFIANLFWGSISIPPLEVIEALFGGDSSSNTILQNIVLQSRLPQSITALLAGSALAVAGLLLQTTFSNPLAGPSVLGITSGASLGVALVMLAAGGSVLGSATASLSTIGGAFLGASAILLVIILFSSIVKSNTMLLIIGIMVGYVTNSAITLLNFFASESSVFSYTIWGMGDFSGVTTTQLPLFTTTIVVALSIAFILIKPLNALLLGDRYAENLGVNVKRTRVLLLISTGLLTAIVTSYCGPISFLGLAVPHIARLISGSSNHKILLPITLMCGAIIALLCNLICAVPWYSGVIPLNAVTPIFGAPVIIYVIVNRRKIEYFN